MKKEAGEYLRDSIEELLKRGEEAKHAVSLGKSGGKEATVKFGYDGTVWPVPIEFGFAAAIR